MDHNIYSGHRNVKTLHAPMADRCIREPCQERYARSVIGRKPYGEGYTRRRAYAEFVSRRNCDRLPPATEGDSSPHRQLSRLCDDRHVVIFLYTTFARQGQICPGYSTV